MADEKKGAPQWEVPRKPISPKIIISGRMDAKVNEPFKIEKVTDGTTKTD